MGFFDGIKEKLGMAAPHMKPADVAPWGEFGWIVGQWYKLGKFWFRAFCVMTLIAGYGWYSYVESETSLRPPKQPIVLTLLDVDGPSATYTTYKGEEPPPKVREVTVKNVFFRLRRLNGSIEAVNDNFMGLTAFMGKSAEAKTRECLAAHPVEELIDQGIRREVKNMRYVPGRLNEAAISVYWTEIERDQFENVRAQRDIELTGTVRQGGDQCPDDNLNPYCIVIEEFSWDVPGC